MALSDQINSIQAVRGGLVRKLGRVRKLLRPEDLDLDPEYYVGTAGDIALLNPSLKAFYKTCPLDTLA